MRWDIRSYQGAGELKPGMSPETAEPFVGQPIRTHTSVATGLFLEMREPEFPDLTYDGAGLVEISFTP